MMLQDHDFLRLLQSFHLVHFFRLQELGELILFRLLLQKHSVFVMVNLLDSLYRIVFQGLLCF